jgi:hypothetical protein
MRPTLITLLEIANHFLSDSNLFLNPEIPPYVFSDTVSSSLPPFPPART